MLATGARPGGPLPPRHAATGRPLDSPPARAPETCRVSINNTPAVARGQGFPCRAPNSELAWPPRPRAIERSCPDAWRPGRWRLAHTPSSVLHKQRQAQRVASSKAWVLAGQNWRKVNLCGRPPITQIYCTTMRVRALVSFLC